MSHEIQKQAREMLELQCKVYSDEVARLQSLIAALREKLDHIPDAGKMVGPEPVAQRELIKELADQYARECVEFAKAIPSGAHSMSPIAVKSGDTRLSLHTAIDAMTAAPQPAQQEPVLFIHPSTLEMASAHVGAWKPGHELPGYIALYTSPPQRQPIRREQRMCPNTYYECGRGCGDGPCKDFDDAYDIKEKS